MKPPASEPITTTPDEPKLQFICDSYRHLVCLPYSVANLHRMAKELGIHRGWFHGGTHPHYDIPKRRIDEIRRKCRIVESREIVAIILTYDTDGNRR
jgi:hypothetical protein